MPQDKGGFKKRARLILPDLIPVKLGLGMVARVEIGRDCFSRTHQRIFGKIKIERLFYLFVGKATLGLKVGH